MGANNVMTTLLLSADIEDLMKEDDYDEYALRERLSGRLHQLNVAFRPRRCEATTTELRHLILLEFESRDQALAVADLLQELTPYKVTIR